MTSSNKIFNDQTIRKLYFRDNEYTQEPSVIADFIGPDGKKILLVPDNKDLRYFCPTYSGEYFAIISSKDEWKKRKRLAITKEGTEIFTIKILKIDEEVVLFDNGNRMQIFITKKYLPTDMLTKYSLVILFKFYTINKYYCLVWIENPKKRKVYCDFIKEQKGIEIKTQTGIIKISNQTRDIDDFYNLIVNSTYDFFNES